MSHYEINGIGYPRVSEILAKYPDSDKGNALKGWAAKLAIKDLCQKLAQWEPDDIARHILDLDAHFTEMELPRKGRRAKFVDGWTDMVKAHTGVHREVLEFLADAGTLAHTMIEGALHLQMGQDVSGPDINRGDTQLVRLAMKAADNWGRWYEQRAAPHGFKPVATELRLVSPTLGYGGTVDCVAEYKGGLWLFDWKTSSRIDRVKHGLQTVAYLALLEEEGRACEGQIVSPQTVETLKKRSVEPVQIDGAVVVRVDRIETAFEHYEVPQERIEPLWRMFKACLDHHDAHQKFKQELRGVR